MTPHRSCLLGAALLALATVARAETVVIDYEDLVEGPLGDPLTHHGLQYHDLNTVSGVFPSGETFGPAPDDQFIAEDAGLFYQQFPGYGSPTHALTFGVAFVPGDNLTIGPLATVTIDLDAPVATASLDIGFYENGPWGGIVYHLDGLSGGQVVASDSYTLSDLGGRDNPATHTLAINGSNIQTLHLYATFGSEYSMPRGMIDNLTLGYDVPVATTTTSFGRVKSLYR
ncbi:MAG: hypothetical protein U0527_04475 [Candidatus Eisenbacteria bacterium]